jgi:hypothetical protein
VLFEAAAAELIRRTAQADWSGRGALADAEIWIEPEVWQELRNRVAQAARELHDAARPPRTPGTIRTSTTVAMFQMEAGR